jgi:hypothetical protein
MVTAVGFISALGLLGHVFQVGQIRDVLESPDEALIAFAAAVIFVTLAGFLVGFLCGTLAAPIGGRAGTWWSFISALGITIFLAAYSPLWTSLAPLLLAGLLGSILPFNFLTQKTPQYGWDGPFREWLQASWLKRPPQIMRLAGLVLPLLVAGALNVVISLSQFLHDLNALFE